MEFSNLLHSEAVFAALEGGSKKQVLQELAKAAAPITGLEEREIFDVLLERERLGTTGMGDGVAIPHGKMPQLDRLYLFFARLNAPVDFESVDDGKVDLIFLLLAPESAGADHLKALAQISRLLRDKGLCAKVRATKDAGVIYRLLTETVKKQAA